MIFLEKREVTASRLAIFPGDLLAGGFAEYGRVLVIEVGVLDIPDVAVFGEVFNHGRRSIA